MKECDALEDLLPLHAIDEASVEDALRIEEHLPACPRCRNRLEEYRRICAAARTDLARLPDPPAWPVLPARGPVFLRRTVVRAAWAAAAAALLLAGIGVGRWSVSGGWLPVERGIPAETYMSPAGIDRGGLESLLPSAAVDPRGPFPRIIARHLRPRPTLSLFSPVSRDYLRKDPVEPGDR